MEGLSFKNGLFGYTYIPKVACTSIKIKMYEIENGKDFNLREMGRGIHDYFRPRLVDISECEHRFLVVRDPVKRFLSAYSNRVGHHNELSQKFLEKPEVSKRLPPALLNDFIYNPSLNQFIENIDLYRNVPPIDWHVRSIKSNVTDLSSYTDVYLLEEIEKFQSKLSEIIGETIVFPRSQTGGRKISIKELDNKQLDFLIEYYKDDYELLEDFYTVDELWKQWKKS